MKQVYDHECVPACLGVALFLEELNDKSLWIPDYSPQVKGKNQRKVQK